MYGVMFEEFVKGWFLPVPFQHDGVLRVAGGVVLPRVQFFESSPLHLSQDVFLLLQLVGHGSSLPALLLPLLVVTLNTWSETFRFR